MTDAQIKTAEPDKKAREGRSPGFPFIDLKKALQRAEEFRGAEGKHSAPVAAARKAWKLGDGVLAKRTIAAMGYFGLFADEGFGEQRKVRLSETALKILLDKQPISPERDELIRAVALKPALHKELWDKWGSALPSDVTIETYLLRDRGFSSGGAEDFIAQYKTTLVFAKFGQLDNMSDGNGDRRPEETPPSPDVAVGDLVQAEINGAYTLPKPARVRAIQEDQGQIWVFVEGSETGIPVEQVALQSKGTGAAPMPPRLPEEKPDSISIGKDEREWLRGPLSKETSYRLIVTGDLGPKEIGKLIKLLEAQKAVLSDEDETAAN